MIAGSAIRRAVAEDLPFIAHTWRVALHESTFWWSDPKEFHRFYGPRILELLQKSAVLVACDPENPSVIQGFCVGQEHVVHWCYVKSVFRRMGIATSMLNQFGSATKSSTWSPLISKTHLKFSPRTR